MSFANEIIHETLPLAAVEINPSSIIALGALAAAGVSIKKITPHWHHTINEGEVGVVLRRGMPVERRDATEDEINSGKSRYKILEPDWYIVPPFRTIQTVYTTDQFGTVSFPLESEDDRQMEVHANITWKIMANGDNPVHAITRVRHEKDDKKDSGDIPQKEKLDVLQDRVLSICRVGLGKVISGKSSDELKRLNYDQIQTDDGRIIELCEDVQLKTIEKCQDDLAYYGVALSKVELNPIFRVGEEVQAQAYIEAAKKLAASLGNPLPPESKANEQNGGAIIPFPGGDAA